MVIFMSFHHRVSPPQPGPRHNGDIGSGREPTCGLPLTFLLLEKKNMYFLLRSSTSWNAEVFKTCTPVLASLHY